MTPRVVLVALLMVVATACTPEWRAALALCTVRAVIAGGAELGDKLIDDIDAELAHQVGAFNPVAWQDKALGAGGKALTSEVSCIAAHLLDDLERGPTRIAGAVIVRCSHRRRPEERHRRHLEALARRCYVPSRGG